MAERLEIRSELIEVRPSRSQLPEGPDRDAVLDAVHDAFGGRRIPGRLPAPQPVSLDGQGLKKLQRERAEYLCTLKADGERYLLVMLQIEDTPVAAMVSRRLDVYEVPLVAQLKHFSSPPDGTALAATVLDGELVSSSDGLHYLVFDAIVIDGRHLRDTELMVRMENVYKFFEAYGLPTNATTEEVETVAQEQDKVVPRAVDGRLRITAKRWWTIDQVDRMWQGRASIGCSVDGIVFGRRYGIFPGTDRQMFKWKASHTVDVCLSKSGPLVAVAGQLQDASDALACHTAKVRKRARAAGPNISVEANQLVEVLCQNLEGASPVVECEMRLSGQELHLRPVKERPDKTMPNDVAVVYGAMTAARERIGLTRLAEACAGGAMKRGRS
jgi:hypothetical protein